MDHRYDRSLKDLNATNSYTLAIKQITKGRSIKVLDVGASSGYVGDYLHNKNKNTVDAIELDKSLIEEAKKKNVYKKIFQKNLNEINEWIDEINETEYDFIIILDVLEHLINPFVVLNKLRTKLKPEGVFIVSIPNVGHSSIMIEQLQNRFTYTETGLTDFTHYRWYTPGSFNSALKANNFTTVKYNHTYMIPRDSLLGNDYNELTVIQRESLIQKPNAHVFQGIFTFQPNEILSLKEVQVYDVYSNNYDELEISILNSENGKTIQHSREIVHEASSIINLTVKQNSDILRLKPSIRFRCYGLNLLINNIKHPIFAQNTNDGIYNPKDDVFTSNGDQTIIINKDIKKGDKVVVKINYPYYNTLEKFMNGQITMNTNTTELFQKIDKYKTISFDIFDTLLLRNVLFPKDIFTLLGRYAKNEFKIEDFKEIRIRAEEKSRKKENNYETSLSQIYGVIRQEGIAEDTIKKLEQKELDLETEFLTANPFMQKIFNYAKNQGKQILLLSDMYLPQSFIKKILEKAGYTEGYSLYVSSECNKTKADGSLYQLVYKQQALQKDNWLHIGDSEWSDVKKAKDFGIDAHWYKSVRERADIKEKNISIAANIIKAIQINEIYNGLSVSYWHKFGVENASPIYFGITKWLVNLLQNKDNIFFLARDGYIIHKIYNQFKKDFNNLPEAKYIYTSRSAYQIPSLAKEHKNIAVDVLTARNTYFNEKITLNEILNLIEMTKEEREEIITETILDEFKFKSLDDEVTDENLHYARKLIAYIFPKAKEYLDRQCNYVQKYLDQEGFNDFKNPNIFDIGWRGSVHLAMKKILDNKVIDGYYFGTVATMYPDIMSNSYGYITDLGFPAKHSRWTHQDVMMLELIFTAPHDKLLSFKQNKGGVVEPVFDQMDDAKLHKKVETFQDAASNIIDKYLVYIDYLKSFTREEAMENYKEFIDEKKFEDLKMFTEVATNVGFRGKELPFVDTYTKRDITQNTDKFLKKLDKAIWKGAFMVKEITNQKEYNQFIGKYNLNIKQNDYYPHPHRLISLENIKKGLKHPRKGIWVIKNKIKHKFR